MQRVPFSPERISVALGLCIVMLAAIPRYMVEGHETRQTLLLIALAIVVGAAAVQWKMLSVDARKALPKLCQRLLFMLLIGALVMGAWHGLFTDWISWQVFISHAATCGLLFHAVSLWWAKRD
ncbi:hypothetical protein J4377_08345 [Halomonas sp. XH26]|uniref:hypothetical protein n=1 Tax=Halomonadaceae TaxID=28256 RepID=UPI00049A9126|nr:MULTISPECIES: hypothetical protein [Halomonas]AIA76010.1 hypothetical protein FF32_14525 [Halomonas campaniensis]AYF35199.1 hypothetical protein CUU95_15825 [Halomonas alkaliphila]UTA81452.1 hypothetical protein J4377_08345 [Halomonas sp. XH26]